MAVSPNDGAVVLRLTGVSKNPADEFHPATVESLSVDVTRKPLIALVWGGFYVLMAGGLLAFVKRAGEARRAVLEAAEKPVPHIVAPTGPALSGPHAVTTLVGAGLAPARGRPRGPPLQSPPHTPTSSSSPSDAAVTAQPGGGEPASS